MWNIHSLTGYSARRIPASDEVDQSGLGLDWPVPGPGDLPGRLPLGLGLDGGRLAWLGLDRGWLLARLSLDSLVGRPGLEGFCGLLHGLEHSVADDVAISPVIPARLETDDLLPAHLDCDGAVPGLSLQ